MGVLISSPSRLVSQPRFAAQIAAEFLPYNPRIVALPCTGTNGIDGTVFQAVSGATRGINYQFNGLGGYYDMGSAASVPRAAYTFMLVSRAAAFPNQYMAPVGIQTDEGTGAMAIYSTNATYSDITIGQEGIGEAFVLTALGPVLGTWHNLVYTRNGRYAQGNLFCNGQRVTRKGTASLGALSGNSALGQASPTLTSYPFNGDIALFVLFSGILPDALAQTLSANPWAVLAATADEIWIGGGSGVALASNALASAAGSAALSVAIPIIGASAASTTGQGTLSVALPLAAAGAASVVGSATLNTNQALASSAAANTTGQGTLGVAQAIAGSGIATAQGTGSLSLSIPINSAALASAIGSGTLNGSLALAAAAVAGVLGQGNLSLSIALSAAAIANAIGSGNLGVSGLFESHAVASAAGQGTLTQRIPISGASLSATNGSGSLTQLVPISGSSVVLASGQGALHLTISMNAAALAQAMGVGNLTLRLTLSGHGLANAIGSATLGGMHRPINPEFFLTGNSLVRYVLGNALIRSL
jgi:hypothetical protein